LIPNQVMFFGPSYDTGAITALGEGIWIVNLDGSERRRIR